MSGLIIFYSESIKNLAKEQAKTAAQSHFNLMVDTRSWNAEYGGIYVKQHSGIEPNKYLKDNILKSDKNETLVKINPAWMTKQISEISNKRHKYYFHITSLKPINPTNKPDDFEIEALNYFEKNKNKEYYYKFKNNTNEEMHLDFIGALITKQECLKCHAEAGYKEGDIRGGIRITVPMNEYNTKMTLHNRIEITLLFLITILFIIFLLILKKYKQEVEKRLERDKALFIKSKQAAMGEMISIIAHQWRQPLAIISMDIGNIIFDLEMGDADKQDIISSAKEMDETLQDLSKTITIFSDIFKTATQSPGQLIVISDVQEMLCNIIKKSDEFENIKIIKEWKSTKKTYILRNEFMQACYMILKNSQEAFEDKKIQHPTIISKTWDEGDFIHYTICDNAGGIDKENIERVFEPYFTTKSYNGRGLGLTIVKNIIEQMHKGTLSLKNHNDGICVHITLRAKE